MAKHSSVGVLNGNWKNRWKRDLDYWQDQKARIIEKNKLRFGDALDELKQVNPAGWEAWYDNDNNIPPEIFWSDDKMITALCERMRERVREVIDSPCQGAFQKIPP